MRRAHTAAGCRGLSNLKSFMVDMSNFFCMTDAVISTFISFDFVEPVQLDRHGPS